MTRLLLAASLALLAAPADRSPLSFPRDHGSHPEAALEWWYWTGHLADSKGDAYGFQLTFFRVGQLHLAHFAWTDLARREFSYEEKAHLELPGVATALPGRLKVSNEDWSAEESGGVQRLRAVGPDRQIELVLKPQKPPVLQGPGGISQKGAGEKDYSRYVSITNLEASGSLVEKGRRRTLSGTAWFDHEWGPGGLPAGLMGWDWFALQLSDGSELMLYRLRVAQGRASPFSSGTWIPARGEPSFVRWDEVRLAETKRWTSPRTKAVYPAGWEIGVPRLGLALSVEPLLDGQELVTGKSTGVTYWEGACRVSGTAGGRPVAGRAYVELTGYAGPDVPGFAGP